MSKPPLGEEQVRLIGKIWEMLELPGEPTTTEELGKIISPDGIVLPEYRLRGILLAMRETHEHGKVGSRSK
jgi:hypothetical protein